MNMKKTMAAIAAGAVAVSAMATTVSAATLETKTITYNLVRTEKTGADAEVKLTAKFYNVPLQDGKNATFTIKNLNKKDIVRITGVYIEEGKQIVPIIATADTEQGGIYSRATDLLITKDGSGNPTGTIVVPIKATNASAGAAFMGGPAEATAATAGTPGSAAVCGTLTATATGTVDIASGASQDADDVQALVDASKLTLADAVAGKTIVCTYTDAAGDWDVDPADYGVVTDGNEADGDKITITIAAGTAAVDPTPATPAQDVVHANITVEVTKKELKSLVTTTALKVDGVTTDRNLTDKDNGLKNVLAELASGANSVLGVGLAAPFEGATGDYTVAPAVADVTASDYTQTVKIYQYPYKSSLNNYLYKATGLAWDTTGGDAEGGDVLSHIYEVKTDDTSKQINPISVQAVINDAIAKHGEVTFTFNTAVKKVSVGKDAHTIQAWMDNGQNTTAFAGQHWGNPIGSYVDNDWDACSVADYRSFGNHYYNSNQAGYDPNTTYILNNWLGDNLFNGSLIVNSNLTLALNDTQKFDWTSTSLSFTWEAIQDEALTTNQYANYIQNMVLRTSADWYWDNMQVILGETEVEEVESGAPVEGDVEDLPEDEEETDLGASEEEEEEEEEESEPEPEPEVAPAVETNPGTGNAPVALAVIPVALAAAAIVAKKRG